MFDGRRCSLALLASCALGCADTPRSCDLDTSSLVMHATVSNLGDRVEVEIELETQSEEGTGAGTALALCPDGDRLVVNGKDAEEVHALGHLFYTAEFDMPGPSYQISLERTDKQSVSVVVDMPPSLEISAPTPGAELSRAEPLEINWAPEWTGQVIELAVSDEIGSSCIEGLGVEFVVDDTGAYSIAANTLVGGSADPSCEVTVSLARVAEAEYPAALAAGGSVTAIVRRRQPFTSVE